MVIGETQIRRWRRFGHDRLYVSMGDEEIGWRDLRTGEDHLRDDARQLAYREAVARWVFEQRGSSETIAHLLASQDGPPASGDSHVARPATPVSSAHVCADLAENRPGASAAARAEALREEREREADRLRGPSVVEAATEPATRTRRPSTLRSLWQRWFGRPRLEQAINAEVRRMMTGAPPATADEQIWRLGAAGERAVGAQLRRLPSGWHVLHAIPVGRHGADIDHLVIGPAGIFTINTKHHPGKQVWVGRRALMVNGFATQYLPKSRYEAARAGRLLTKQTGWGIPVSPVIAVVGAGSLTVREAPDDVVVLSSTDLATWLQQQPVLLRSEHVDRVFAAARACSTWHG